MTDIYDINDFAFKRCDVLGIGVSNIPLIRMLVSARAIVTARDKKTDIGEIKDELLALGVRLVLGEDYLKDIDADFVFRSPGIRPDVPEISEAVANGAVLTSEMALFCDFTKANIIAITGSDGKTTTTTLTHKFIDAELKRRGVGRAYVGGNIGTPLLSEYANMTEDDYAVLELSSFQLMDMCPHPVRAAITNVTPNHLNWHPDMEEYTRAKTNIFDDKTHLVLNADNAATLKIASESGNKVTMFSSTKSGFFEVSCGIENCERAIYLSDGYITVSDGKNEEKLFLSSDILIPGKHIVENYMTAIGLTYGIVSQKIYHDVAVSFGGVEHRLELVRILDGVKYYNSSIDSSPTRTAAALSAVEGGKVVICGGYDKGFDFAPLADVLCKRARCVVLTGATADKIMKAIEEYPNYADSGLRVVRASDFAGAVDIARDLAVSGESVILSPACASFDAFKNFEERGRVFKALVLALDKKN